ncbi:MAG TPA: hypothetical protein VGW37_13550 [Terriglobia bacterium]|nr:hypothetical protein [Terriglobia bacterium]
MGRVELSITLIGAILIPLTLAVFFFRPDYLLPLLVVSAAFPAATVFNITIGNFPGGVQPFYFVALFVVVRIAVIAARSHRLLPGAGSAIARASRPLLWFWMWAVASAFVLPVLFRGTAVLVPREGIPEVREVLSTGVYGEPLHWSLSNLAQAGYLTLCVAVVIYAARVSGPAMSHRCVRTLRLAVGIVAVVAIVQLVALEFGWGFPYGLLNTNPVWSKLYAEEVGGISRVSSTFSEPSVAGGFLAASWLGLMAELVSGRRGLSFSIATACVFVALLRTTASTGYATAVVGGALMVLLFRRLHGGSRRKRVSWKRWLGPFGIAIGVAGAVFLLSPSLLRVAGLVTLGKLHSGSLVGRVLSDAFAMRIFLNTYGLGAGLGSNRPSSFITYLLSNVGLVGCVLFGIFIARMLAALRDACRAERTTELRFVFWMTIGWLVAMVLSVPDLSFAPFWAILATAVSAVSARSLAAAMVPGRAPAATPRIAGKAGRGHLGQGDAVGA